MPTYNKRPNNGINWTELIAECPKTMLLLRDFLGTQELYMDRDRNLVMWEWLCGTVWVSRVSVVDIGLFVSEVLDEWVFYKSGMTWLKFEGLVRGYFERIERRLNDSVKE